MEVTRMVSIIYPTPHNLRSATYPRHATANEPMWSSTSKKAGHALPKRHTKKNNLRKNSGKRNLGRLKKNNTAYQNRERRTNLKLNQKLVTPSPLKPLRPK